MPHATEGPGLEARSPFVPFKPSEFLGRPLLRTSSKANKGDDPVRFSCLICSDIGYNVWHNLRERRMTNRTHGLPGNAQAA